MNSLTKTLGFVGGAIALALIAAFSSPGAKELPFFDDVGDMFFPDFDLPGKAAELEVWEFIAETAEASAFNVKSEKGLWTIPSHHGYPADGKARMASAAGLLIGLTKDGFKSDQIEDHASFGVIDPTGQTLELEGRGMRITIKDGNGSILGDLIVGNEVAEHRGQRYVRLPGKKRTYTTKLDFDLSVKFEDWIERDLLKAKSLDLKHITFDNYSIDEARGAIVKGDKIELDKPESDWLAEGMLESEEINKEAVSAVTSTITGLKIVGVRPKPKGLTANLERTRGITREILMSRLAQRGYFLSGGKLYSNEGDLLVKTSKGIVYTLKFGEVVLGSGEALTAGGVETVDVADADVEKDGETGSDGSHRYLMVTVAFDEALLDKPEGEALPQEHIEKMKIVQVDIENVIVAIESYKAKHDAYPASLTDLTIGDEPFIAALTKDPWGNDLLYEKIDDGFVVTCQSADGAVGGEGVNADLRSDALNKVVDMQILTDALKTFENEVADGQEEAAKLADRFGAWYYVIDAESFNSLHVERSVLVKKKATDPVPEEGK